MVDEQTRRTGTAVTPSGDGGLRIGISIGDLNGIGPELVIKTFSDPRMAELCTPVIFANSKAMTALGKDLKTEHPFSAKETRDLSAELAPGVYVFSCWEEEIGIQPGVLNETGGKYAVRSLQVAAQCMKDGQIDGLVTAPIHKSNTYSEKFPFTGHTPFLKETFGAKDVVMLLYNDGLRVALVTEHLPLAQASSAITKESIASKLAILRDSLTRDFGIEKPRVAVLGLNPHAGDEGRIGREEEEVIKPAIEAARTHGQLVFGPYSADAFFARRSWKEFDAVLAMYHDQGLVPFKMLAAENGGVNYTAGLPIIRTSPDHGTAFDIAGKGIADESSFREAVFQCIDRIRARRAFEEATANPLPRKSGKSER